MFCNKNTGKASVQIYADSTRTLLYWNIGKQVVQPAVTQLSGAHFIGILSVKRLQETRTQPALKKSVLTPLTRNNNVP
ncbi:MAG: hypothetical protein LBH00_03745 [Planctomycetaceae bacterium]|nr:hypothetical protein [Planctomycetaceae bacterium]